MNCPACGNPVSDRDHLCPKCYAPIERPGFWQRFLRKFSAAAAPRKPLINITRSVTIKTVGKDGERHEYHSMTDVPPEIRSQIEAVQAGLLSEKGDEKALAETARTGNSISLNFIRNKKVTSFKFVDKSGVERTFHSLDEMPPEIRAIFDHAQGKLK